MKLNFLVPTAPLALVSILLLAACTPSAKQMTELLENNPEILTNAIEKHPDKIMAAMENASHSAETKAQEARLDAELKNPLQPEIDPKRPVMGSSTAPITIVEYTDFQCPYCAQGYETLEQVRKHYGDKVKVLVKHLPLPMHPMAVPAAKRYEALVLQDPEKAFAFYHEVFANQEQLNKQNEKFLDAAVKKTGANLPQVKKDMESSAVNEIVKKDIEEAQKFGISGTPGFIINGVSLRGAYPFEEFQKIIDRMLAAK